MLFTPRRSAIIQRLLPLLALTLFILALWVLHDALRQFYDHHLIEHLRAIRLSHILGSPDNA